MPGGAALTWPTYCANRRPGKAQPPPGANHLPPTNRSKSTILSRFCSKNDSLLARIFNYFISILMPEILHL
ncbi:hypothetical protein AM459_07140 [Klebsiella pneumoniae]|nr:hypothetical protein AM459_07140 [Klebsiella pneumoniae]